MTRCAIYTRQSLDRTGEELGVQRQEAECRRLCEQRGYGITEVLVDNSVSATAKRPGYEQLLQLIETGAVDVVVVLRIDRLLRRLADLEQLIDLSERTGVQIVTVYGDIDLSSSQGRLVGRLLASVARAEVETKGERQKLANLQKAQAGKPHGSRRPYGYEADLVTIYEPEATVLRQMAEKVIDGASCKEVAHWLNREGYFTTLGRNWYPITVRNMLMKKRYAGIRSYKGAEFPAAWPAVFDTETWERLQLALQSGQVGVQVRARKYLLTGLLYCGKCGLSLNGSLKQDHPGRPRRRTYQCRGETDTGLMRGCRGVTRNADALDDFISEAVFYRLDTPELASLLHGDEAPALQSLLRDRQAQRLRLDGLVDDYATGLLNKDQLARAKATAEAELERIETELNKLQRQTFNLPAGQTVRQAWDAQGDEWRRSLLALLIKRIDVMPGITKPFYVTRSGQRCRFDPSLIGIEWLA